MKIPAQAIAFHPDSLVAKSYVINAPAFKNNKKHGSENKDLVRKWLR
jgi:HlyD family secretion protein